MPSYMKELQTKCNAQGCLRKATQAVYNTRNAHQGNFCLPCAKRRLKVLKEQDGIDAEKGCHD